MKPSSNKYYYISYSQIIIQHLHKPTERENQNVK